MDGDDIIRKIVIIVTITLIITLVLDYNNTYKSFSNVLSGTFEPRIQSIKNKNNYDNLSAVIIKNRYNFINLSKLTIVAHRGASSVAPENSIPAIDAAAKIGYWGVELDVCSSSDGVLYLLHDGKLNRSTNGHGLITKKTLMK